MSGNPRTTAAGALSALSIALLLLISFPGQEQNATYASGLTSPDALQSGGGALGEREYWLFVDRSLQRLAEIEAAPVESAGELLSTLIHDWEELRRVTLEDGTAVPVSHDILLSLLSVDPPDLAGARQLLQHMRETNLDWSAPRHGQEALGALAEVLSRPEFSGESTKPGRLSEWLSSLRQRLLDLWYGTLDRLVGVLGPNRVLRWAVFAASALALAWVTVRAVQRMRGGFIQEAGPDGSQEEAGLPLSAQEALRLAHDLSQTGDFRSAVRYLYMSSLISLEERGLLRHDRSKTNREYLRMLANRPDLADILREVVEVFDRVWYGFQRLDQASFARYAARVEDLRRRK